MSPYDYITSIQNANGPILNVAQSLGITINQINIMNNSFNQVDNSVHNFNEKVKENATSMGFFRTKLTEIGGKIKSAFSPESIFEFGKKVFDARVEYEKLNGIKGGVSDEFIKLKANLDQFTTAWNTFLASLGGDASGLFMTILTTMNEGLSFLTGQLPNIATWFSILWKMMEPVVLSLRDFIKSAFSFVEVGAILDGFGLVMTGVLLVVSWLTTGLKFIIDTLKPFATEILILTGAWLLLTNAVAIYSGVMAVFNAIMAASPITWIIVGILALALVIGMIIKYTSGWGESWRHVVSGAKFLWDGFTETAQAKFNTLIQNFMIGIDKIKIGWYKFKEAVGMGNSSENLKMIAQINGDVKMREKSIAAGNAKADNSFAKAKNEFSQVKINVDTAGISRDFKKIKDTFGGAGAKTNVITDTKANPGKAKSLKGAKDNNIGSSDSIVSGGPKATNIIINIQKLQDDTKIYVESSEKGISNLGEKVQEMLLRAVNSVNQMQTAV
jgi:hypothetical protein